MSDNGSSLDSVEDFERKISLHLDALKQGETLYRNLVHLAPDAFITANQFGKILFVNQAAEILFGYSEQELKNLRFIELFLQTHVELVNNACKSLIEFPDPSNRKSLEISGINKNQNPFPVEVSLAAVPIGKKPFLTAIIRNITERKMAEAELKLLKTGLESTANAIIITNRSGIIEWINPAFTHMTGYSYAECRGNTPRFLKSGKHDPAFYKKLWATIMQGYVWRGEIFNRCRDGTILEVEQTITPVLDSQRNITHFIGVKQDITARRLAESEQERLIKELKQALDEVKILHGMLPICCCCKKIRDDKGYWQNVESYIELHSHATFSHGMCPECIQRIYPQYSKKIE